MPRFTTVPTAGRRSVVVVALVTTFMAAAGTTALPASASLSVTAVAPGAEWSVAPADGESADGRISLRHVADPGERIEDHIVVTNHGAATEFVVQAGDGIVGADGAFDVAAGEPAGAGAWIHVDGLDGDRLALDVGETRMLTVTIAVPEDALPGDHPAGVVVGVSSEADGVSLTHRMGVRLHLRVAGEIEPALTVRDVEATYSPSLVPFAPGTLRLRYEVANEGNVRLGAASLIDAHGPLEFGWVDASADAVELLPGDAVVREQEMEVWPLIWLAGGVTVAPTSIGDDQVPLPVSVSESFTVAAVPWTGLVLLVVLIGVGVAAARTRPREQPSHARS